MRVLDVGTRYRLKYSISCTGTSNSKTKVIGSSERHIT